MLSVAQVLDQLEGMIPLKMAAEWDNVGLLLGERERPVERIMTCLTVTPETAQEAIDRQVSLIITHHPILFKGTKRLNADTAEGRMVLGLTRASVAVYSPHTAFDNAPGGINDLLASRLGLKNVMPLRRLAEAKKVKLVVFVPESDLARVQEAVFTAGAGRIGEYGECSFRLLGTGTFHGSEASNPTVGQKGQREEVQEWRLEVICPEERLGEVVMAMRRAHSYEEPAFDIYPLVSSPASLGEGRIGELTSPLSLEQLAENLKQRLKGASVQVVGERARLVQRVALVCGAGGEFLSEARRAGAEVFLTGEMRFHEYLTAQAQGISVLLPGHYASERCGVEDLAERLSAQWPEVEVWASERERDPVIWI